MTVFHINYEPDRNRALARIDERIQSGEPGYVCVADGNILSMVHEDLEYRKVVQGSMFSIVDSSWVPVFVKRLYGLSWQQYCGSQIFEDMVSSRRYRMCFLGTDRYILEKLKAELSARMNPDCSSMEFVALPFCAVEDFDYAGIAEKVDSSGADVVWVALGAPKQEIFASRLMPLLGRGVIIPVGAVFKFYSGTGEKRSPEWMRKSHLEFLYRVFQSPAKQIRRCWGIVRTLPAILREEKRRSVSASPGQE